MNLDHTQGSLAGTSGMPRQTHTRLTKRGTSRPGSPVYEVEDLASTTTTMTIATDASATAGSARARGVSSPSDHYNNYFCDDSNMVSHGSASLSATTTSEAGSSFSVVIRVRPPVPRELNGYRQYVDVAHVSADCCSVTLTDAMDSESGRGTAVYARQTFTFDHVYDEKTTQQELYDRSARPAVLSVLEGYNTTLMAYGQTGTGKTYTMEGFTSESERGVIPRAVEEIFDRIEVIYESQRQHQQQFVVRASYMQIYNEVISDLLMQPTASSGGSARPYTVRHTPQRGVYVDSLSEWVVRSPEDVYMLIERGTALRATSTTRLSEVSSRSHAVFTIVVEAIEADAAEQPTSYRLAKMNIVDLAGSEKVRTAGVTGQRLEETKSINRSLHELGNVISALAAKPTGRVKHIPFRNSVLTSVLRDSLGGNCKTTLIACISPALEAYAESLSTLTFANRAKNIRNHAVINEDADPAMLVRRYEKELAQLRRQLREQYNANGGSFVDASVLSDMEDDRRRALAALKQSAHAQAQELRLRQQLEQRIAELESILGDGGRLADAAAATAALSLSGGGAVDYAQKLEELDTERRALQEDKSQVDRYKQLLLKQRDIMLSLTTRLNERDEIILQLQEEIDAYDAHVEQLEGQLARTEAAATAGQKLQDKERPPVPQLRAGSLVNQSTVGSVSKKEAEAYVQASKVTANSESSTSASQEGGARYRSELNPSVHLCADEKLVELLMLHGGGGGGASSRRSGSPSSSSPTVDPRAVMLLDTVDASQGGTATAGIAQLCDALRNRIEEVTRRYGNSGSGKVLLEKATKNRDTVADTKLRLRVCEERCRVLERCATLPLMTPVAEAKEALRREFSAATAVFQEELATAQVAAAREQEQRRKVAREVDRIQFEVSRLLETVSFTPQQRAEASRLWQTLRSLEDEALASCNGDAEVGDNSVSSNEMSRRKLMEKELAACEAAWRCKLEEQQDIISALKQQQPASEKVSAVPLDAAVVSRYEGAIAKLTEDLQAHRKDRRALQTIMESRIKAKVDRICELIPAQSEGGAAVERNGVAPKEDLAGELGSLKRLVDASVKAMAS